MGCGARSSRRASRFETTTAFFCGEPLAAFADEVDAAVKGVAIDDDLDDVAVEDAPDGTSGECFGRDVADAGSGGDAAEARVGEYGDVFAVGQVLERGGDLVDLLHARACRSSADEDDDVSFADGALLDGGDGGFFGDEDARGTDVVIAIVFRR